MDKTTLDNYKAEEREKSSKLHRKLALLCIIHQPTEEFLKIFKEDMFAKPNDKAFFQVMYYLFNILDPNEVKKRFYWPITDKKYESMFRTATVNYVNFLIEKHGLKWQQFKSYLVVKPGGMKFLVFLHDFIDFLVNLKVSASEKNLNIDNRSRMENISHSLKKIKVQSLSLKAYASKYCSEMDIQKEAVETFISQLKMSFTKIYALTGISERVLCYPSFHKYFQEVNIHLCKKKFNKTVEMDDFYQKLETLNQTLEDFHSSKKSSSQDIKAMEDALADIKTIFSDLELSENRISNLITAFNKMFPYIVESHQILELPPKDIAEHENNELHRIRTEANQLEAEYTKFITEYNLQDRQCETPKKAISDGLRNLLQATFISTPPLRFSVDCADHVQLPPRIPFWEISDLASYSSHQDNSMDSNDSFMNSNQKTAFQIPGTVKKNLNRSVSKKSFVDPAQFLMSLKKDKSRSQLGSPRNSSLNSSNSRNVSNSKNLSNLASKWKACSQPFLLTPNKINQNIAKLQTTNDALLNLSTSPSGKLDPMVNLDSLSHTLNDSKAKENKKTNESLDNLSWKREREDELTLIVPTIKFDGDDTDLVENSFILEEVTVTENEKTKVPDMNISNLCSAFEAQHLIDDDPIFNISDTVLNDVPDF